MRPGLRHVLLAGATVFLGGCEFLFPFLSDVEPEATTSSSGGSSGVVGSSSVGGGSSSTSTSGGSSVGMSSSRASSGPGSSSVGSSSLPGSSSSVAGSSSQGSSSLVMVSSSVGSSSLVPGSSSAGGSTSAPVSSSSVLGSSSSLVLSSSSLVGSSSSDPGSSSLGGSSSSGVAPPVAVADTYPAAEDTPLTVNAATGVLANDTGVGPLTATLVNTTTNGVLAFNSDGSFSYTPGGNYAGADAFSYTASGPGGVSNEVTVTINVVGANDAPTALAEQYATQRNTTLNVAAPGVLGNDTDPDVGDTLTALPGTAPTHGMLTLYLDGSFTYVPDTNYDGPDLFTYEAVDSGGLHSGFVIVDLNVVFNNQPPVALDDNYTVAEDGTLNVAAPGVLGNDADPELSTLSAARLTGPTPGGSLTLNSNGSFTFTPPPNAFGAFTFTYAASDGSLNSNAATVTITVTAANDAPVAVNDGPYTVAEEAVLNVPVGMGVLANDTDVENDTLSAVLVTGPTKGLLTLSPDGSFVYTPNVNAVGADSFTYQADDGDPSNTATVSITITNVNDAPVGVAESYNVNEDTVLGVTLPANGVLANDTDVDLDTLTAELVTAPVHATSFTLNANGTFTYTPVANYFGPDSFVYHPRDAAVAGNDVTVSITVNSINDDPVAVDDPVTTAEDTPVVVDVVANDLDVESGALTVVNFTQGTNGVVTQVGNTLRYAPAANYTGPDSFTYTVQDPAGGQDIGQVNVTVTQVNDAPVANNDTGFTAEAGAALTVVLPGVLVNDVDVESNPLTAIEVTGPSQGALTLNPDGSFTYTPNLNATGSDSFTYKANDGVLDSNTATVTITIQPVDAYVATLNGLQEVPATGSAATGNVTCRRNTVTGTFACAGTHNLTNAPSAAHVHNAQPGVNGGVVFPMVVDATTVTLNATPMSAPQRTELEAGNLYINIHTGVFPGGEVRGQLIRPGESMWLSTINALPAVSARWWYVQDATATTLRGGGTSTGTPLVVTPDSGLYSSPADPTVDLTLVPVSTGVDSYSYSGSVTPVPAGFPTGFVSKLVYNAGVDTATGALTQVQP